MRFRRRKPLKFHDPTPPNQRQVIDTLMRDALRQHEVPEPVRSLLHVANEENARLSVLLGQAQRNLKVAEGLRATAAEGMSRAQVAELQREQISEFAQTLVARLDAYSEALWTLDQAVEKALLSSGGGADGLGQLDETRGRIWATYNVVSDDLKRRARGEAST